MRLSHIWDMVELDLKQSGVPIHLDRILCGPFCSRGLAHNWKKEHSVAFQHREKLQFRSDTGTDLNGGPRVYRERERAECCKHLLPNVDLLQSGSRQGTAVRLAWVDVTAPIVHHYPQLGNNRVDYKYFA
jgi:hypothetical protein